LCRWRLIDDWLATRWQLLGGNLLRTQSRISIAPLRGAMTEHGPSARLMGAQAARAVVMGVWESH
jgi:hypothetical protein